MALSDLIAKITKDADAQIERLNKETAHEAARFSKETDAWCVEERHRQEEKHAAVLRNRENVFRARIRRELKIDETARKRTALDAVFRDAVAELRKMPTAAYEKALQASFKDLAHDAHMTIYAPPARMEETRRALSATGRAATLATREDIHTGFIAATASAEYDYTFERLVKDRQKELESQIAGVLFDE